MPATDNSIAVALIAVIDACGGAASVTAGIIRPGGVGGVSDPYCGDWGTGANSFLGSMDWGANGGAGGALNFNVGSYSAGPGTYGYVLLTW